MIFLAFFGNIVYNKYIVPQKSKKSNTKTAFFSKKHQNLEKGGLPVQIVGVICEYNLFHYGHARQLALIREKAPDATVLSLMSGDFVQRGELSPQDKYLRAELAVRAGADLVLELPFPYAMSGATYFARGAVATLHALGADALCFGCESDIDLLLQTKDRLCAPDFTAALQAARDPSTSLANQRAALYEAHYGEALTTHPNDMLAIEYLCALDALGSTMQPMPIRREGEWSATKMRAALYAQDREALARLAPPEVIAHLPPLHECAQMSHLDRAILAFLRTASFAELQTAAEMTADSAAAFCRAAQSAQSVAELLAACASKRYSHARLRRMLWSAVLGVTEADLNAPPQFTTLLAANEKGTAALKTLKKRSTLPILTKPAHADRLPAEAHRALALQRRAAAWYGLAFAPPRGAQDYLKQHPYLDLAKEETP